LNVENPDGLVEGFNAVRYDLKEREKVLDEFNEDLEGYATFLNKKNVRKQLLAGQRQRLNHFLSITRSNLIFSTVKGYPKFRDRLPSKMS